MALPPHSPNLRISEMTEAEQREQRRKLLMHIHAQLEAIWDEEPKIEVRRLLDSAIEKIGEAARRV